LIFHDFPPQQRSSITALSSRNFKGFRRAAYATKLEAGPPRSQHRQICDVLSVISGTFELEWRPTGRQANTSNPVCGQSGCRSPMDGLSAARGSRSRLQCRQSRWRRTRLKRLPMLLRLLLKLTHGDRSNGCNVVKCSSDPETGWFWLLQLQQQQLQRPARDRHCYSLPHWPTFTNNINLVADKISYHYSSPRIISLARRYIEGCGPDHWRF